MSSQPWPHGFAYDTATSGGAVGPCSVFSPLDTQRLCCLWSETDREVEAKGRVGGALGFHGDQRLKCIEPMTMVEMFAEELLVMIWQICWPWLFSYNHVRTIKWN